MSVVNLAPWQQAVVFNPFKHFAFFGGVAVGKSHTGARFAIKNIIEKPNLTGFIGANTYTQLSQATLKHFYAALEDYGLEFVSNKRPPNGWKVPYLDHYKNTTIVYNPVTGNATLIYIRTLSKGNPIRGVEFSWYWIDETRDTPEDTHDIIMSRLRENEYVKGLITTTTNGKDWAYQRFCENSEGMWFGSMHIPTKMSLDHGIITQHYYDSMRKTYSELKAQQELDALHVNIDGGRAYYAHSDKNKSRKAPWGDSSPDIKRPIIVGCDFNFSPAPCVWVVGQLGPSIKVNGKDYSEKIHWFQEISGREISTQAMTHKLISMFPGYYYQIYGDSSGGMGTTSNAGRTDYIQMSQVFDSEKCLYSISRHIDKDKQNPKVRERVENVNRLLQNSIGVVTITYDPQRCPLLDKDFATVGWKNNVQMGKGRLDDGGDKQTTHASDAVGYALHKIFPPLGQHRFIPPQINKVKQEYLGTLI